MLTNRQATGNQSSGLTGWQPGRAGSGALSPALLGRGDATFSEDYDARPENQCKNLINIAPFLGLDVRQVLEAANQAGEDLLLLELRTPELVQADCASYRDHQQPDERHGARAANR